MIGSPGSDPSLYSSASQAVDLSPGETVRDVKKKLISLSHWTDERPEDFGLFDDASEEPLKDALPIEVALSIGKAVPTGRTRSRRAGGWVTSIKLPRPYVGILWAARVG